MGDGLIEEMRGALEGNYTDEEYETMAQILESELREADSDSKMFKIEREQEKIKIFDRVPAQDEPAEQKISDSDVPPEKKTIDGNGDDVFGIR